MDMKIVYEQLCDIFSVLEPLITKSNMAQIDVSQEEFDRKYKIVYKIEYGADSGCVAVSSTIGDEPVDTVIYVVTPELRVLNEFKVYECDFDELVMRLNKCITALS